MGAGKTAVGRRLAQLLGTRFVDSDDEIVAAAGMSIADIFELYGEPAFRDLERRVIERILADPPGVLALGGGAFLDPVVRRRVCEETLPVWLRADLETLVERTARRRSARPLLAREDPRVVLKRLMEVRHPVYAQAALVVESTREPIDQVVRRVLEAVQSREALR